MARRYQIWDKQSRVITPIGEVLTPEQWIERYPMAEIEGIDLIIGAGTINGSVCMEYSQTVDMYENMGCDFTGCETKDDYLIAIENFEDEMNNAASSAISPDERIAAALEAQVMMAMDDIPEEEITE